MGYSFAEFLITADDEAEEQLRSLRKESVVSSLESGINNNRVFQVEIFTITQTLNLIKRQTSTHSCPQDTKTRGYKNKSSSKM